jgi:hypothetical protein
MPVEYPIYRKSLSEKSFYAVIAEDHCIEIQLVGSRRMRHDIHARILPDRLFIQDLIDCAEGHYVAVSAEEFAAIAENS